jgi:hypothetical protein
VTYEKNSTWKISKYFSALNDILLDILTGIPFNEICAVRLTQRGHKTTAGTGDTTQRGL